MAVGFLDQAARQYLTRKITSQANSGQTRLSQIKRLYYVQILGGTSGSKRFNQLETEWMVATIRANGGTADTSMPDSDLWRRMVASIGKTPARNVTQNQFIYWSNAS